MKTTIDLPDALADDARAAAAAQGTTLRELVVAGLRAELARRGETVERAPFRLHTVGGRGLRPGVSPSRLTDLAYES